LIMQSTSIALCFVALFVACHGGLPVPAQGFYCLLADDSVTGYTSSDNWQPALYDYQTTGANVLWFTFINPQNMTVPPAFANLAKCRGQSGCPTSSQKIIFSIGGEGYSNSDWPWLASQSAAASMAQNVAQWPSKYGCDGIDIDLESPAGDSSAAASNAVYFVQQLRAANPNIIITVPVYGYPQVPAEISLVNAAFTPSGTSNGLADSIGIMVYQDLNSLNYVKDYANATNQWYGFPITSDVPTQNLIVGIQGTAAASTIQSMANAVAQQNLGGVMVWFASVWDDTHNQKAFTYSSPDDASSVQDTTGSAWQSALNSM